MTFDEARLMANVNDRAMRLFQDWLPCPLDRCLTGLKSEMARERRIRWNRGQYV